jgi:putative flavoprotein involved in K+ transport
VTWLNETTWFRTPVSALPAPAARLFANIQATGKDGGHDLHYRTLQAMGVNLLGRLAGVDGHHVRFADDLAESVAWGDARYADFGQLLAAQLGGRAPHWPDPPPFRADTPVELNLRGFGAVIFTSGFRPDYAGWVRFPRSTPWVSRSPTTGPARWSQDCTSAACTSCVPAGRRSYSGWGRTPRSSLAR